MKIFCYAYKKNNKIVQFGCCNHSNNDITIATDNDKQFEIPHNCILEFGDIGNVNNIVLKNNLENSSVKIFDL